ncbi:hypothetical protein D3C71_1748850 [compost metagenome]
MLFVVTDREKATMNIRMQRLHTAVHDFRETGHFGDIGDCKPGCSDSLVRSASR